MRPPSRIKALLALAALLLTIPSVGCTKEKAEAIKNAAEQFRVEAKSALSMSEDLVKESVSMPAETKEEEINRLVQDFNTGPKRTEADMQKFAQEVLNTGSETLEVNHQIEAEFKTLEDDYDLFASMYRSLPRGHFFAKDAVAKSERHAIKLTLRFIKMADTLQKMPVVFMGRRATLTAKLLRAQEITGVPERAQAVLVSIQDLIKLREDERKAKEAAILQCLKAAEAGKLVTELINGYQKLTVEDMLNLTKDSLAILNSVTGGTNKDIKGMQTRFESFVKNKIRTDPVWGDVLQNEIHWQELLKG